MSQCCRKGAQDQVWSDFWVRRTQWAGRVLSVLQENPFQPVPHPLEVTSSLRRLGACGHHPSLCVYLQGVSHLCALVSVWGCVHTMRVRIFAQMWICPSGAGWGFWSSQLGVQAGSGGWASLQPWVRFLQSSFQPSLGTCSDPGVLPGLRLRWGTTPGLSAQSTRASRASHLSCLGFFRGCAHFPSPGNALKSQGPGSRAGGGQSWSRGPVAVCVCFTIGRRAAAGAGERAGGA